jgi:hypothetical protein
MVGQIMKQTIEKLKNWFWPIFEMQQLTQKRTIK